MSDLIAVTYDDPQEADRVLSELYRLQKEYLIDLADAVVAIRHPDGRLHLKQSVNMVKKGALSGGLFGAFWGTLVGLLFLNPLLGLAVGGLAGGGAGALAGTLVDYGIDDNFIRSLAKTMKPDSSALFVLIRKAQPERVLADLSQFKGHVLRTSLSPEQESRLRDAIERSGAGSIA